jgi:hypothetical protein
VIDMIDPFIYFYDHTFSECLVATICNPSDMLIKMRRNPPAFQTWGGCQRRGPCAYVGWGRLSCYGNSPLLEKENVIERSANTTTDETGIGAGRGRCAPGADVGAARLLRPWSATPP